MEIIINLHPPLIITLHAQGHPVEFRERGTAAQFSITFRALVYTIVGIFLIDQ